MKNHKIIPLIGWFTIGGLICYAAKSLELGSLRNPGSGIFPFCIGCAIILLSLFGLIGQLFSEVKDQSEHSKLWSHPASLKRVLTVLGMLIFYMITLKPLGFLLCTFILFSVLLRIVERKDWKYTLVASLAVSVASHFLFQNLLKINLPKGLLGI